MSKFDDMRVTVKNMFRKKHSIEEDENPSMKKNTPPSMIEGEQPKIHGVRRGVVIAIASVILVIVFLSTWWTLDSSIKPHTYKSPEKTLTSSPSEVADQTGLPNDYSGLAGYDKEKKDTGIQASRNTEGPGNPGRLSPVKPPYNTPGSAKVSRIAPGSYSPLYQPPHAASQLSPPVAPQKQETVKNKYNAAISFALERSKDVNASTAAKTAAGGATAAAPVSSSPVYSAMTNNMLQAGVIIPAILMTGINSDIGGQVVAQIQQDVYDSMTGVNLLIPAGSRIIGEYTAGAANGQSRIAIKWNTLQLPGGGAWSLGDGMVAVDGAGYAGVAGKVNEHTGKMIGAGAFTSALAALGSVAAGNTSNTTNNNYNVGQLAMQGAMSNLLNTASSLFQKNINIQPTITIEPGYQFNIFVTKPIVLK